MPRRGTGRSALNPLLQTLHAGGFNTRLQWPPPPNNPTKGAKGANFTPSPTNRQVGEG